jgi:hypothetical protein
MHFIERIKCQIIYVYRADISGDIVSEGSLELYRNEGADSTK